jgi:hypothetical protein
MFQERSSMRRDGVDRRLLYERRDDFRRTDQRRTTIRRVQVADMPGTRREVIDRREENRRAEIERRRESGRRVDERRFGESRDRRRIIVA